MKDDVLFGYRLRLFALAEEIGVRPACRAMGVHHSTYYRWAGYQKAAIRTSRSRACAHTDPRSDGCRSRPAGETWRRARVCESQNKPHERALPADPGTPYLTAGGHLTAAHAQSWSTEAALT